MGIVAKRSSMTFYSDPTCHYSHRVRIVLAEKGVTVDIEDVDNLAIPEEVLALNPYGVLPTLIDRDLALYETKVMMEYLDERFPHPPLLPVYPVARALSRQFMFRIEKDCSTQIDKITDSPEGPIKEKARTNFFRLTLFYERIFYFGRLLFGPHFVAIEELGCRPAQ